MKAHDTEKQGVSCPAILHRNEPKRTQLKNQLAPELTPWDVPPTKEECARWEADRETWLAQFKAILSYREPSDRTRRGNLGPGRGAREAFEFLVKKGCEPNALTLLVLSNVKDDARSQSETASGRRKLKEKRRSLIGALEMIESNADLIDSAIHESPSSVRHEQDFWLTLQRIKRRLKVRADTKGRKPWVLRFNPRERQWLGFLHFVSEATGKFYRTKVATVINAMLGEAHAPITAKYLNKLLERERKNERAWAGRRIGTC
jgi:hypothetical protein